MKSEIELRVEEAVAYKPSNNHIAWIGKKYFEAWKHMPLVEGYKESDFGLMYKEGNAKIVVPNISIDEVYEISPFFVYRSRHEPKKGYVEAFCVKSTKNLKETVRKARAINTYSIFTKIARELIDRIILDNFEGDIERTLRRYVSEKCFNMDVSPHLDLNLLKEYRDNDYEKDIKCIKDTLSINP